MPLRRLLPLTLLLLLAAAAAAAEAPSPAGRAEGRVPSLESRQVDRSLRGEILEVFALTEEKNPRSLLHRGLFEEELGLWSPARDTLAATAAALGPQDPDGATALAHALGLARLDTSILPPPLPSSLTGLPPRLTLEAGGHLIRRGDSAAGAAVLASAQAMSPEERALATASGAQARVEAGDAAGARELLESFRTGETSPESDLVYLLRGYHQLEAGDLTAARESFLALPAESVFAPETLHGLAWILLKEGNLPAGVVRLEELRRAYPESTAAREAALDLGLAYRDLGLFDDAARLLADELRGLTEERKWLESLGPKDLAPRGDLALALADALAGSRKDAAWKRLPPFARLFCLEASADPATAHADALERGSRSLTAETEKLAARYLEARRRVEGQQEQLLETRAALAAHAASVTAHRERLPALRRDYLAALDGATLRETSSDDLLLLADRVALARGRLGSLLAAQEKARGFSSVVKELAGVEFSGGEERQLRRLREDAYKGIASTRETVDELETRLRALEGKVWLAAKTAAVSAEESNARRVAEGDRACAAALEAAGRGQALAEKRGQELAALHDRLGKTLSALREGTLPRLEAVAGKAAAARDARVMRLARERAVAVKDAEARILYTSADIEISRLEDRLRSMQGEKQP